MPQTIRATIDRCCYPREDVPIEEPTWQILRTDRGTFKGRLPFRPESGDCYEFTGEHSVYQGNKEFSFASARLVLPEDPRAQLAYVAAHTKGMGPTIEDAIWQAKGADWMNVEKGDVPKLSERVLEAMRVEIAALASKEAEAQCIGELMQRGATQNLAQAAWAQWKEATLALVRDDPYRLVELPNYGFADVDKQLRRAYGIEDSDPRRIKGAVFYGMKRLTDGGDTVVKWTALYGEVVSLVGNAERIAPATRTLIEDGKLVGIKEHGLLALAQDWQAESEIWAWVKGATA